MMNRMNTLEDNKKYEELCKEVANDIEFFLRKKKFDYAMLIMSAFREYAKYR
jgi:hypothetical protein